MSDLSLGASEEALESMGMAESSSAFAPDGLFGRPSSGADYRTRRRAHVFADGGRSRPRSRRMDLINIGCMGLLIYLVPRLYQRLLMASTFDPALHAGDMVEMWSFLTMALLCAAFAWFSIRRGLDSAWNRSGFILITGFFALLYVGLFIKTSPLFFG